MFLSESPLQAFRESSESIALSDSLDVVRLDAYELLLLTSELAPDPALDHAGLKLNLLPLLFG